MGSADLGRTSRLTSAEPGSNLAALLDAWTALLRTGRKRKLAALLHPNVAWTGVVPESGCNGRKWVLHYLRVTDRPAPRLTRVEASEFGDKVLVSVESPDFEANEWLEAGTPRTIAFTFEAGMVVRMQSYATREEALAATR